MRYMVDAWEMYFKYIGMYENEFQFKGFYDGKCGVKLGDVILFLFV